MEPVYLLMNIMVIRKEMILQMDLEKNDNYRDIQYLHDQCKKNMHFHVILTMKDGSMMDGIIENVEPDRVIVLVGEDVMEMERDDDNDSDYERQFFGPDHRPRRRRRRRFRRFRRRHFPFANLAAISLLPYPFFAPPFSHQFPW